MHRILILTVALIVHGSLYPWRFADETPANPLWTLLNSWSRFLLRDVLVNVVIYVPVGAAAWLTARRFAAAFYAALAALLLGGALSVSVEMAQLYTPLRDCSAIDLLANTAGAGIGAFGLLLTAPRVRRHARATGLPARSYMAALLVLCWLAHLAFPPVPVLLDGAAVASRWMQFNETPIVRALPFVTGAVVWWILGLLIAATGTRKVPTWLLGLSGVIPATILLRVPQPVVSDLLGALGGCLLFFASRRSDKTPQLAVWALVGLILVRGLAPFNFGPGLADFTWIPFAASLEGPWQRSVPILAGKVFYYGAAIWLLAAKHRSVRTAAAILALLLAAVEAVQIYLPGRTPEITDPLIALLVGWIYAGVGAAAGQHHVMSDSSMSTPRPGA